MNTVRLKRQKHARTLIKIIKTKHTKDIRDADLCNCNLGQIALIS
jgi:hypothetical protein